MGMDIFIIALLIFIGLVMVILEVFFLPGITIAGISAVLFFVGAVFYAFMQLGEFAGYITIAVSVIVTIVGIVIFIRSRSLDRMALKTTIDSVAPTLVSDQIKVGDEGVTLSRLNLFATDRCYCISSNFLLFCSVSIVDIGDSIRCQYLSFTAFPDAYS